jgi:hypothetical protein
MLASDTRLVLGPDSSLPDLTTTLLLEERFRPPSMIWTALPLSCFEH